MRIIALAIIILPPLLAACATLDEGECRTGNWQNIGENDGIAGRSASFISNHAEACAEYGIRPDIKEWEKGRRAGLKFYCTPQRAFTLGRKGRHLSPVCPADQIERLNHENQRGFRLFHIEREIDQIEDEIDSINLALSRLPLGDPRRASLISERAILRLDLWSLRAERARYI